MTDLLIIHVCLGHSVILVDFFCFFFSIDVAANNFVSVNVGVVVVNYDNDDVVVLC